MKKIIFSMLLVGTLLNANAQVPSYVPSNGLIGWWPFSGNANDQSGNGNNGTVNGATLTNDRYGNSNSAYSFDGVNDYISNIISMNTSDSLTIVLWYNSPKPANISSTHFELWESTNVANQIHLNFSFNPIPSGYMYTFIPGIGQANDKMGTRAYNTWNHVVIVKAGNTQTVYVNNKSDFGQFTGTNGSLKFNKFEIGREFTTGGNINSTYYDGKLDDFGIWGRALSVSEINDLYNGCKLSVSTEPTNQSSNINAQAQFNVVLNDTTANYQWQSNASNMGWANVPSSSFYSGVSTKKLTVNNIQVNNHKQLFRVIASKNTCKDTSVVAMLTVNDTCITSTTDTLYIKVNTSSLNNPIYNTVKVYPNPSSTQVIIDNGNYSTMGTYTAKIVNSIGQQVFQSVINQQQFVIDAKTMGGAGVYTLYITDSNNKVVGVKKIVLQ